MTREAYLLACEGGRQAVGKGKGSLVRLGYVHLTKDGELLIQHINNTACHAGLDGEGALPGRDPVKVFSTIWPNNLLSVDEQWRYLDWLLNRSPYRNTFCNKSPTRVLSQGFIVSDAECDSSLMVGGLVASRRLWEFVGVVQLWLKLVDAGVNENLAFWAAHAGDREHGLQAGLKLTNGLGGHRSIACNSFSSDGLRRWVLGMRPCINQPKFRERKAYYGYHAQWVNEMFNSAPFDILMGVDWVKVVGYYDKHNVPDGKKYVIPFPRQAQARDGRWSGKPLELRPSVNDAVHYFIDKIQPKILKEIGL